jgi:hypothetical protein
MRTILFGSLVAAALAVVGVTAASAAPGKVISSDKLGYQASDIIRVGLRCGPGRHVNRFGRCV